MKEANEIFDDISNYIKLKKEDFDIKSNEDNQYLDVTWCELKIRGYINEINKCKEYLEANNIKIESEKINKKSICEITVCAGKKTIEIIKMFPLLKMMCFYEEWTFRNVIITYSESGFASITASQFCGYFDRRADGGDGRWHWEHDITEDVNLTYQDIQTGEDVVVRYVFPYKKEWDADDYVFEIAGEYYYKKIETKQEEFKIKDGVLKKYSGNGGDVVIPNTVTEIDWEKNVFQRNNKIVSLKIPGTVKKVPIFAFEGCKRLKSIDFEDGVQEIGSGAFGDCSQLESISLPESVKHIGSWSFHNCINLDMSKIQFPNGIEFIESDAFEGCINFPKEIISNNRLLLYNDQFEKEYVMPEYITEIASNAFTKCRAVEKIYTSNKLKRIAKQAVSTYNLLEIKLAEGIEIIEDEAFCGCRNLTEIALPESIQFLGKYVFEGCQNLTKVVLPNSLETLPDNLFFTKLDVWSACIRLKEVVMPEKLKNIGYGTFCGCRMLQEIMIPSTVQKIENLAFKGCSKLKKITLPYGLKSLGVSAFRNCDSLEEMRIPGTLKKIPNSLFAGCKNLRKVVIEEGVTSIGSKAFYNCPNLEEIYIYGEIAGKQGEKIFYESPKVYGAVGKNNEKMANDNGVPFVPINV